MSSERLVIKILKRNTTSLGKLLIEGRGWYFLIIAYRVSTVEIEIMNMTFECSGSVSNLVSTIFVFDYDFFSFIELL